jgi:hypothetical protein
MPEEKDPADETAFMWNVDKLARLEKECEKENSCGEPATLDGINFVLGYAKAIVEYFKKVCRSSTAGRGDDKP